MILDSNLSKNTATDENAVFSVEVGTVIIQNSEFWSNSAEGAQIISAQLGTLTISGSTFGLNSAGKRTNGIFAQKMADTTSITDCNFYSASEGGQEEIFSDFLYFFDSDLNISNSGFEGSKSKYGGVYYDGEENDFIFSGSTYKNGVGITVGCMYIKGKATIKESELVNNTNCIFIKDGVQHKIDNTNFTGNSGYALRGEDITGLTAISTIVDGHVGNSEWDLSTADSTTADKHGFELYRCDDTIITDCTFQNLYTFENDGGAIKVDNPYLTDGFWS